MIHINRNRQSLGQFSEQEVADGLQSGKFLPDDLAWREPMESWQALSTFTDLPQPSGFRPATPAAFTPVPSEEVPGDVAPAWERPSPPPFFAAIYETVKEVLSNPVETFRRMPVEGGYAKPAKFYVLLSWLTTAVAIIYQAAAAVISPELILGDAAKGIPHTYLLIGYAAALVVMPVFLYIGAFVSAGVFHVALMMVGGAGRSYEATFRAVAYANGTCSIFQLIPICGAYISSLASLVYVVIALKETHRTDLWRPIVAILLILLLCCGAAMGIGVLAAGLGAAATGALK